MRQILALDDTAHSKALGVAIGMFIGMTPTVGIQMVLVLMTAVLTARFFYFNRVAALLTVYVSNPLTTLPIYWLNYQVGTWFVPGNVGYDEFAKILVYKNFAEWWQTILGLFVKIGPPLIVGSLVVATVCGVVSYPLIRWLLSWFPQAKQDSQDNGSKTADCEISSPVSASPSPESKP